MKNLFRIIVIIFSIILTQNGCLKDSPIVGVKSEVNNAEKIIAYLESQGDYINSAQMPSLDTAERVHDNLPNYEILDVRTPDIFIAGHIPGSKNVSPVNLLSIAGSISRNKIILIVSQTGQAASYYTALLRFAGYNNVYALKFGMAIWNQDFAGSWVGSAAATNGFTNKVYERPPSSPLPQVDFDNTVATIKGKINSRLQSLLETSFGDPFPSGASTDLSELGNIYNSIDSTFTNTFIVCFGHDGLYILGPNGDYSIKGHPPHSVFYFQSNGAVSDLRSTTYLQTIPSSKNIVVYSEYGQSSAFLVAYLRLLGYNAKSLLFGANWREPLPPFDLYNYPYDKGN